MDVRRHADRVHVVVDGEVDDVTSPALVSALAGPSSLARSRIVVDLAQAAFFGLAGVDAVERAAHVAAARGGQVVVRGASGLTARVLRLFGLGGLLEAQG